MTSNRLPEGIIKPHVPINIPLILNENSSMKPAGKRQRQRDRQIERKRQRMKTLFIYITKSFKGYKHLSFTLHQQDASWGIQLFVYLDWFGSQAVSPYVAHRAMLAGSNCANKSLKHLFTRL